MAGPTRAAHGRDPFGLLALAGAGTIAAHELGYLAGPSTDAGSHAHLALIGPVVIFALVVAGWSAAVKLLRDGGGTPPSWRLLVALQLVAYATLEVGERAVVGQLDTIAEPPVILGLVAQPIIAWVAVVLLRLGRTALIAIASRRRRVPRSPRSIDAPVPVSMLVPVDVAGRVRMRGPPSA